MERKRKRRKDSEVVHESPSSKRTPTQDIDVVLMDQPQHESPVVNGKPHNPLKPKRNSWLPHVSNLILMRCLQKAKEDAVEFTCPIPDMEVDWDKWAVSLLNSDDIQIIYFYIAMELQQSSSDLSEIQRMVQPYDNLNITSLSKADIKEKYKELIPKAPMTAFFRFLTAKRQKLVEKHPELPPKEVSKKLSEKWKSLSDGRKEKYRLKYRMEKEQYAKDMEQFYEDYPEAKPSTPIKKKTKPRKEVHARKVEVPVVHVQDQKELDFEDETRKKRIKELQQLIPKVPTTSYFLFCKAKRTLLTTKHPNLPSNEVTKKLAIKWKSMSEERKEKYKQMFIRNKEEYQQEMALVTAEHPGILEELKELKMKVKKFTITKKNSKAQTSSSSDKENEESEEDEEIITEHVTKKSQRN